MGKLHGKHKWAKQRKGKALGRSEPCSSRGDRGRALGQSARQQGRRAAESRQDDKIPNVTDEGQQREADNSMPDSKEEEEVRDGRGKNSQDTLDSNFFS